MVRARKVWKIDLIKTHPKMGAEILSRYPSTRQYAEVALGHHKWYDNSRGYPSEFDTSESPQKALIDLVMCCDCLDAATDTVGRSYNRGCLLHAPCADDQGRNGEKEDPGEIIEEPVNQIIEEKPQNQIIEEEEEKEDEGGAFSAFTNALGGIGGFFGFGGSD